MTVTNDSSVPVLDGATASAGLATASAASNLLGKAQKNWNESNGPDVLKDVVSTIPESTKKIFSPDKFRPFTVYFGIGDEKPYSVEKNATNLVSRIKHNLSFFYLNYLAQSAFFYGLTILFSPGSLLEIGILALAWILLMRATNDGVLNLGVIKVTRKVVSVGMTIISAIVLLYVLSNVFWWALTTSLFFVFVHAVLRDASKYKDESEVTAETTYPVAESPVVMEEPKV